ncbi:MAG: hypothetical protein QOH96_209 [Blastocatellia bacterium]|nr:hypothetical protein [Blastocatellia bacterium]
MILGGTTPDGLTIFRYTQINQRLSYNQVPKFLSFLLTPIQVSHRSR